MLIGLRCAELGLEAAESSYSPGPYDGDEVCFEALEDMNLDMILESPVGTSPPALETSGTGGRPWAWFTPGNTVLHLSEGDKVWFRAGSPNLTMGGFRFRAITPQNASAMFAVSGDIRSLLGTGTMGTSCFKSLFAYCENMVSAPRLPAALLTPNCYQNMFLGCASLASAPFLPAATLVTGCYDGMFEGCYSLSEMAVAFSDWNYGMSTSGWVKDTGAAGTFFCPQSLWQGFGDNYIPTGWTVGDIADYGSSNSSSFQP